MGQARVDSRPKHVSKGVILLEYFDSGSIGNLSIFIDLHSAGSSVSAGIYSSANDGRTAPRLRPARKAQNDWGRSWWKECKFHWKEHSRQLNVR